MRVNRRWKIGWVAIGIATAGLLGSNGLASGAVSTNAGFLRLHFPDTNAAASFTRYGADGTTVLAGPQNLTTAANCGVNGVNPGSPALAKVTASGGSVGAETSGTKFIGLGVKSRGSGGTNCGRVEAAESLTVGLNSGLEVIAAELDIDGKGNAVVRADLYNGGTSPVGFALLATQAASGDSGPDATSGDNFAFPINDLMPTCLLNQGNPVPPGAGQVCGTFAPFTSVMLSTSAQPSGNPSFALEGGRTGDPRSGSGALGWDTYALRISTPDSVFKYGADGVLNCGETTSQSDETTGISTDLSRGFNDNCVAIPYDLDLTVAHHADLHKDLSGQTGANFYWTIRWAPETPPVATTQIDYGTGFHPVLWCLADGPDVDTNPDLPPGESWCFTNRVETLNASTGLVQATETLYGAGDPRTLH